MEADQRSSTLMAVSSADQKSDGQQINPLPVAFFCVDSA
jgi:hypothetical protein